MTSFDLIALGVIAVLTLTSMLRGLAAELVALLRWVVAGVAARFLTLPGADILLPRTQPRLLAYVVVFLGIFVTVFLLMFLLRKLLGALLSAMGLDGVNRVLGGLFGILKGVVLVTVGVMALSLTELPQSTAWRRSQTAPFFELLGRAFLPGIDPNHGDGGKSRPASEPSET